jgi:hypothetical protein
MGFGILLTGYFLILNLTYYGATDLISGIVMMMAFYKLRTVNKYFSFGVLPSALFALVGVPELVELAAKLFGKDLSYILTYTAAARYLIICIISILMMKGIHKVSEEVEVYKTAKNARNVQPFIYLVFGGMMILELPITFGDEVKWIAPVGLIFLLGCFALTLYNLSIIYSAYRWICMPEDVDNDAPDKPSRFGIVNSFRERQERKNREYAEYKLNKMTEKATKKKKGGKK